MKDFWQKLPNKGQPPNSGHWSMYQLVLSSEVPLYSVSGGFDFLYTRHAREGPYLVIFSAVHSRCWHIGFWL